MKIENKTEEQYKEVARLLEEIGLKPIPRVLLMANIVGVCEDIAKRMSSKEIVNKYNLGMKADSFASLFKSTTGVSVKEIPSIMFRERRRIRAEQIRSVVSDIAEEDIEKLLDVMGIEKEEEQSE